MSVRSAFGFKASPPRARLYRQMIVVVTNEELALLSASHRRYISLIRLAEGIL
jgi:hypothetical protein